jgi:hypothetical protein
MITRFRGQGLIEGFDDECCSTSGTRRWPKSGHMLAGNWTDCRISRICSVLLPLVAFDDCEPSLAKILIRLTECQPQKISLHLRLAHDAGFSLALPMRFVQITPD